MLFSSLEFLVFLGVVLVGYHLVIPSRRWGARKTFLLCASYVFYMAWHPVFALILLGSSLLGFVLGPALAPEWPARGRRIALVVSLVGNLGALGFFKYGEFVTANVYWLLGPAIGYRPPPVWSIALPIGISFYVFEVVSYSLDVYRGVLRPCRSFLDFALFLAFFPHVLCGPIVRAGQLLPQFVRPPRLEGAGVETALARIGIGFVKKVLFADTLGAYVDLVFANPSPYGPGNVLLAVYAYAYQIYFDFSGYTDIAIGLAGLFGLGLPENFDRPYMATSPRDFWRRWHVTLSAWLRDYVYVSLGGNRRGPGRTQVNLLLTMLLGGLWHGAGWHFVAWGGYHGILLVLERMLGKRVEPRGVVTAWLARLVTFHLVCAGWVLFRAESLADAWLVFARLASPGQFVPVPGAGVVAALLAIAIATHSLLAATTTWRTLVRIPPWCQGMGYAAVIILCLLLAQQQAPFIYFQF